VNVKAGLILADANLKALSGDYAIEGWNHWGIVIPIVVGVHFPVSSNDGPPVHVR
jgi:hypothetical protein